MKPLSHRRGWSAAWRVWAMPVALALGSAAGMVLGLWGIGMWRGLGGVLMAWPAAVGLWMIGRR